MLLLSLLNVCQCLEDINDPYYNLAPLEEDTHKIFNLVVILFYYSKPQLNVEHHE